MRTIAIEELRKLHFQKILKHLAEKRTVKVSSMVHCSRPTNFLQDANASPFGIFQAQSQNKLIKMSRRVNCRIDYCSLRSSLAVSPRVVFFIVLFFSRYPRTESRQF